MWQSFQSGQQSFSVQLERASFLFVQSVSIRQTFPHDESKLIVQGMTQQVSEDQGEGNSPEHTKLRRQDQLNKGCIQDASFSTLIGLLSTPEDKILTFYEGSNAAHSNTQNISLIYQAVPVIDSLPLSSRFLILAGNTNQKSLQSCSYSLAATKAFHSLLRNKCKLSATSIIQMLMCVKREFLVDAFLLVSLFLLLVFFPFLSSFWAVSLYIRARLASNL